MKSYLRRLTPVLAYVAVLWAIRGLKYAVIAVVLGLLMILIFSVWNRNGPQSLGSFTHRLNSIVGGPRGEAWPWRRRTRGLVLIAIGLLGFPAGLQVVQEPREFRGGSTGGAVLALLAVIALLVGISLIVREPGDELERD